MRRLVISTSDTEGGAVDRAYNAGEQRVLNFRFPKCPQLQPLIMDQLKCNTNEETKPGARWAFDRLGGMIRHECLACSHSLQGKSNRSSSTAGPDAPRDE